MAWEAWRVKFECSAYIMQIHISSMMGILFLLLWGPMIEKLKILDGIFQLGDHQAQVLQANQAGRESTQFASPGIWVISQPAWLAWSTWAWWSPSHPNLKFLHDEAPRKQKWDAHHAGNQILHNIGQKLRFGPFKSFWAVSEGACIYVTRGQWPYKTCGDKGNEK